MRRTLTAILAGVFACAALLVADESIVDFDQQVDFSVFKTYAVRDAAVESSRPEIDNPLFMKNLGRAIRSALTERGLAEVTTGPDLLVDYRITSEDLMTVRRSQSIRFYGLRGRGVPPPRPQAVPQTQGTLVIDLFRAGEPTPVWRGVYRDDEKTGARLVQNLLADARKLIARYPPRK